MLFKNLTIAAATVMAVGLTAGTTSADPLDFLNKETNGRSSYIGLAVSDGEIGRIGFRETRAAADVSQMRNGRKINFDDHDGLFLSLGNDYGYVRLESEFGYREVSVKSMTGVADAVYTGVKGKAHVGTAMLNMAFEYSVDPVALTGGGESSGFTLTPFITAGGGVLGVHGNLFYKRIDLSAVQEEVDNGFFLAPAVQGGAGVTLGLPYGVEVFGKYSEMLAYTYNFKDTNDIHIKSVTGGLRFNF
jgi:hypothetical protein